MNGGLQSVYWGSVPYILLLLYWAKEYYSLQWGLHYMGVCYIKVPLYMKLLQEAEVIPLVMGNMKHL